MTYPHTTGFLIQAIKQNWANPDFVPVKSEGVTATRTKTGTRTRTRSGRKGADAPRLRDESREAQITATCRALASEDATLLNRLVDELLDGLSFHRELYDPDKTPLDNYCASPILAALVDDKMLRPDFDSSEYI